jgi:hypothetical protein
MSDQNENPACRHCVYKLNLVRFFSGIILIGWTSVAPAQEKCATVLAEARQRYEAARFQEAIDLVNRCLAQSGLTNADSVQAYESLGKAYFAKDDTIAASQALTMLLALRPAWEPDPEREPPLWVEFARAIIKQVKDERQKKVLATIPTPIPTVKAMPAKNGRNKKWLWIGGGTAVVAAGITAAIVLSDGTADEKFVPPPGRPR